ncbi:MAG: adenine phosphoribosyltransferase [Candidatus Dormibacteraeota bacterium]|nr:adenine phosphoribosyltransferase [Candidatus Dormibacteraeota bacterium]
MATDQALAARLRALIHDVPDFPKPGIVFRDITALLADARAFADTVNAIAEPHRAAGVAAVAGIESRGFILGGAVARELGAGFVAVRKQGRLPRATLTEAYNLEYGEAVLEVHADALSAGERVLIVDDLLATGGTATAAASLFERLGCQVVGLSFLVELAGLGGAEAVARWPHGALVVI